ncbi:MAG: hypothetical protein SOX70_04885 [Peptoniphilaceae bacterium]|nr:hypothetical protein [Peptoniphilaceae bacterium]
MKNPNKMLISSGFIIREGVDSKRIMHSSHSTHLGNLAKISISKGQPSGKCGFRRDDSMIYAKISLKQASFANIFPQSTLFQYNRAVGAIGGERREGKRGNQNGYSNCTGVPEEEHC